MMLLAKNFQLMSTMFQRGGCSSVTRQQILRLATSSGLFSKTKGGMQFTGHTKVKEGSSEEGTVRRVATQVSTPTPSEMKGELPKLPVPLLNDTLAKYLRTVKPLLSDEDFKKTTDIVKEFGMNPQLGPSLQSLLENKANSTENWMSEWWLNAAYLEYRLPVIVHSSPGLVFPLQTFKSVDDQLSYAAKMVYGALSYNEIINKDRLKPDMMGKTPLDMSQYNKIFGTTRNPAPGRDVLVYNPRSQHIVVAYKNYFYQVNVTRDSKILSPEDILAQIKQVVERTSGLSGIPVGLLTSDNRDTWAKVYERLRKDKTNAKSLKAIEESLFILSIDRPNRSLSLERDNQTAPEVEDIEYSERQTIAALQMLHGNKTNSGNRWFDKTIGFIVGTEGEVGLVYEHSPAEGPPVANMMDFIVQYMSQNPAPVANAAGASDGPILLDFNLKDKKISKSISEAKDNLDTLIQDLDMSAFTFKKYGKEFIKTCKMSPDSYIQMAIQAAFYRLHKTPAAHYESASVRMYVGGRTECIRSCSIEAVDFAQALLDTDMSAQDKFKYMKKAVESHKSYAADAVRGLGVDRHLFGLKKIAVENGKDIPHLFMDEGYVQSCNFRLSTSQVPSLYEAFMCYGPVVPDGYGCCYNPTKNSIVFGVSAFNSSPETNANRFKQALQETLVEMQKVGLMSNLQPKL